MRSEVPGRIWERAAKGYAQATRPGQFLFSEAHVLVHIGEVTVFGGDGHCPRRGALPVPAAVRP